MSNRKNVLSKYILLAVLFVVTAVITFLSMGHKYDRAATTTMTEATLPLIQMKTEDGMQFNRLHGYIGNIDASNINDPVTPLPDDKKLQITISTYDQNVTGISYKVRAVNDMSLIENTELTQYSQKTGQVDAVLNIKNLIEDNTEYLLQIIVSTNNHEAINYYTKIISGVGDSFKDKVNFALQFNECTYHKDRINNIAKYIETNPSADNTDFGRVDINCKTSQIGWGDLTPFVESTIVPTIKEIDDDVAIICLDYTAGAENEYNSYDTYKVNEYYRIRQANDTMYLLNFEREARQVFDSRNDMMSNSKINLGINPDKNVEMAADSKNDYTYFVNQGTLWCYDNKENLFTNVFSFSDDETDNIRESYNQHDIKIINVKEDGNCDFIVTGYMNRGQHEGGTGVALYSYDYESNVVNERVYIPLNVPYGILKNNVGLVAHLSDNNTFNILIDSNLYLVDLTSKEVMVEVSGLKNGTYAVSDDGRSIAYNMDGDRFNSGAVRIYNMEKGTDKEIKAEDGDKVRVLGFIKGDFIYGTAHEQDIRTDRDGNVIFPMYKINILDGDYNMLKEYNVPGVYVSDAQVNDLRLNLSRVVKNPDGSYSDTSIDQLINREENSGEVTGNTVDEISTELRQKEVVIQLAKTIAGNADIESRASKEVVYVKDDDFKLEAEFSGKGKYYVYGYGRPKGSYSSLSEAIEVADKTYGTVKDGNNKTIWNKYRDSSAFLKDVSAAGSADSLKSAVNTLVKYAGASADISGMDSGKTAIDVINEATDNKALNLKGIKLNEVLYFINAGYPVMGKTGQDSYVVITAYDSNELTYMDPVTGKTDTENISDVSSLFAQYGNVFITYYK